MKQRKQPTEAERLRRLNADRQRRYRERRREAQRLRYITEPLSEHQR